MSSEGGGLFASLGVALDEALRATAPPPGSHQAGGNGRGRGPGDATGSASTSDPALQAESAQLAFWASCVVAFLFYFARGVFTLALLLALGAAYLNNPVRVPSLSDGAWEPLLAARASVLASNADEQLSRGRFMSALKSAFVDGGVRLLRGRKVMVDFLLFSVAFIDSASTVDQELVAVGVLGQWRVLRSQALRSLAASHVQAAAATPSG